MKRNIGIYSGTFDPVHKGHVAFALEAASQCGLEKVYFLPERFPRQKHGVASVAERTAQLETVLNSFVHLEAMTLDEHFFTVRETLPKLEALFAGNKLTLLLGSDVAKTFRHGWPDVELLLEKMPLAIGLRAGDGRAEVSEIMTALENEHGFKADYTFITALHSHVTSTQVRSGKITAGI